MGIDPTTQWKALTQKQAQARLGAIFNTPSREKEQHAR